MTLTHQPELGAATDDDGETPALSCPVCARPLELVYGRDGQLLGWSYMERSCRCNHCGLRVLICTEPTRATLA